MVDTLTNDLEALGLDRFNFRVLALLPLVEVAWADGRVQAAEARTITRIAREGGFLSADGEEVLARWLAEAPTAEERAAGMRALVELARRSRDLGSDIHVGTLRELIDLSAAVARSAGGLFGLALSTSEAERRALDEIAATLSIDSGASWSEMLQDLGD